MDGEYPKMLYREGTEFEFGGLSLDTLTVETADAEADARDDGWADVADLLNPETPDAEAEKPRRGRPPKVTVDGNSTL